MVVTGSDPPSATSSAVILQALKVLPRVRLAHLPTPLDAAPRLSAALDLDLRVKRDDLTGLALGGNKTRQLEFLLGDALQQGATAVITGGSVQSNHCRQLAAACARLGLRACLILRGEPPSRPEANALLDALFGAEQRFLSEDRFYADFPDAVAAWSGHLVAAGEHPYVIDTLGWDSGSLGLAAAAYVLASLELEEQFAATGWRPGAIYLCSGAATQAGLVLAKRLFALQHRIVGVSASPFIPRKPAVIAAVATRTARLLGLGDSIEILPTDVTNLDGYIGAGYGVPTPGSVAALRLVARTEGLLLDPTYTAKAFAALVEHVHTHRLEPGTRVLFLHTGGMPALFQTRYPVLAGDVPTRMDGGINVC